MTIENLRKLTNELAAATRAVEKAEKAVDKAIEKAQAVVAEKEAVRDAKAAELTAAVNAFKNGGEAAVEVEEVEEAPVF